MLSDFVKEIDLTSTHTEMGLMDKSVLQEVADTCNLTTGCCKELLREEVFHIVEECWV